MSGIGGAPWSARIGTAPSGSGDDASALGGLVVALEDPAGTQSGVKVYSTNTPTNGNVFEITTEAGRVLQLRKGATLAASYLRLDSGFVINGTDGIQLVAGAPVEWAGNVRFEGQGAGAGLKIGTAAAQKLGFYGVAPVAQQARPVDLAGVIALLALLGLSA